MALGSGMIGLPDLRADRHLGPAPADPGPADPGFLHRRRDGAGHRLPAGGRAAGAARFLRELAVCQPEYGQSISGVLGVVLAIAMPADAAGWGWRIPFLFGMLIAPVGFYIRNNLPETLAAEDAHPSMRAVLADILGRYMAKVLLCLLVISGATITQYFMIYTTSYAIATLGFPRSAWLRI